MAYIYDLTDTWNAGGTTFYGIKMNVTNTASASGSKLLSLQVGGSEKFGVDKDGNVGVGTASPGARLETSVTSAGATAEVLRLSNPGSGANTQAQLNFYTTSTSYATITGGYGASAPQMTFNLPSVTAGNYVWQISSSEKMRLDASGNVGIGTATPSAKLSVVGTAKIGEGAASNSAKLMVNTVSGAAAGIQLFQDGNESWVIENPASTTALTFANSGTERMRIAANGYVGIGTNAPDSKLHVAGTGGEGFVTVSDNTQATIRLSMSGGAQSDFTMTDLATILRTNAGQPLLFSTNATERMRIDTSGNVGIGTTAPATKFVVSNSGAAGIEFDPATGIIQTYNRATTAYTDLVTSGLQQRFFSGSSPAERMRIDSSGNVGIGTTAPAYKLDVSATGNISGRVKTSGALNAFYMEDAGTTAGALYIGSVGNDWRVVTGSNERMRIDASGNVQVGTGAIATTATDGFLYIPTCAGTPTGTPTAKTGFAPMVVDSTNNKLYVYVGGAWQAMN